MNSILLSTNKNTDLRLEFLLCAGKRDQDLDKGITWILDSGATIHATINKNYLLDFKPIQETIHWGKASKIIVRGKGDLLIKFKDTQKTLLIRNVYYIPELGINILSISSIPKLLVSIDTQDKSVILSTEGKYLTKGKETRGLYYLYSSVLVKKKNQKERIHTIQEKPSKPEEPSKPKEQIHSTVYTWHYKLGHIGIEPLIRILKSLDIKVNKEEIDEFKLNNCPICQHSKSRKIINKVSRNIKEFKVLDRIYSDIGGPIAKSYDNYRYYITFLDRASKYLAVTLLKTKDEAHHAFNNFKALVENQNGNGKRIKELFTDQGTEYTNKRFQISLNEYGIIHSVTPAHTQEPRGAIERINLTLLNKVRTLLLTSKAPTYLWGEALLTAVYLYNRTPHSSLGFKTPYELYHGIKPSYNNIKTWGSIVYYSDNKPGKPKLQNRKRKAVLVGYGENNYIYKVWDIELRKALFTRDVVILENIFRFNEGNYTIPEPILSILKDGKEITQDEYVSTELNNKHQELQVPQEIPLQIQVEIPVRSREYYAEFIRPENELLYIVENIILCTVIGGINNVSQRAKYVLTASTTEPTTFKQAQQRPEFDLWFKACQEEVDNLVAQNTFTIVDLPDDRKAITGRWVFRLKPIDNSVVKNNLNSWVIDDKYRYKARWVAQGFHQRLGVDYLETFATTCRTESWRTLLILCINKGYKVM